MDYFDKFVMINVKNSIKAGFKIFEIKWFTYFKTKANAQKAATDIKERFDVQTKIKLSAYKKPPSPKYLLLIVMSTTSYPKKFQQMNKTIKAKSEVHNGEYDGYEFGMLQPKKP